MSIRALIVLLALCFTAVATTGCAAQHQQYSTGIPQSSSEGFYSAMTTVATDRGYQVGRSSSTNSLTGAISGAFVVIVPGKGRLQYHKSVEDSDIQLTVMTDRQDGEAEEVVANRMAELRTLSDELTDAARGEAERNAAFR